MNRTILYLSIALAVVIAYSLGFATGAAVMANEVKQAIIEFVDYSDVNVTINLDEEYLVDYAYLKAEQMRMLESYGNETD